MANNNGPTPTPPTPPTPTPDDIQWMLTALKLNDCDYTKMKSDCKDGWSSSDCKTIVKSCVNQAARLDCSQIDNFVDQWHKKTPVDGDTITAEWNKLFTGDSSNDWAEKDLGNFVGRLGGNLKCLANAINSKFSPKTKANIPSDALDQGIREGQKTVTKRTASMVIGLGVLLMILLSVAFRFLFKNKPKIAGLVDLVVVVLLTALMIVYVMKTNM